MKIHINSILISFSIFFFLSEEDLLLACLRNTKYDVQKAVKKIEKNALLTKDYWEYLSWKEQYVNISRKLIDEGIIVTLPNRDSMGRKVIIINLSKRDPEVFSYSDLLRTITLNTILLQDDEITSLTGFVFIFDGSGLSLQHMISMKDLQYLVKTSDVAIARIKKTVLHKFPYFMNAGVKFAQSIQSQKMRERIETTNSIENIHRIVKPKSILPESFGGEAKIEDLINSGKQLWSSEKSQRITKYLRENYVDFEKVPKKGWFGY